MKNKRKNYQKRKKIPDKVYGERQKRTTFSSFRNRRAKVWPLMVVGQLGSGNDGQIDITRMNDYVFFFNADRIG